MFSRLSLSTSENYLYTFSSQDYRTNGLYLTPRLNPCPFFR